MNQVLQKRQVISRRGQIQRVFEKTRNEIVFEKLVKNLVAVMYRIKSKLKQWCPFLGKKDIPRVEELVVKMVEGLKGV